MKKILAVLLAFAMLFAFAACGGNEEPETTTAPVVDDATEAPATDAPSVADPSVADPSVADPSVADPSAADPSVADPSAADPSAVAPAGEMTAAQFVAFYNAESAKAAKGSYKYNRTCTYVNPINVGDMTNALNKVIKMVDENSDLNSVVGGFLGIGNKTGNFPKDDPDDDYQIKAAKLTEADLQNFKYDAATGTYSFTLANANNPKKTNATPISRFMNDFITHEEVDEGIKDAAGSLITLKETDVKYTNIKVTVKVVDNKVAEITYQYNFAATLSLKILVGNVNGSGSAKTTGAFTNIAY
ncbi:MAG: hypothetical protein IJO36_00240 [Clostridia bacterium]|nr:hypothetical protein [Clostridia bacterium]